MKPSDVQIGEWIPGSNLKPVRSGFGDEFGKKPRAYPHVYVECECRCGRVYIGRWADVRNLRPKDCKECAEDLRKKAVADRIEKTRALGGDGNELQIGKAGEYLVCADLIMAGFVAFPSEQGLPYDVVVDLGRRLIKVQVKTTKTTRSVPYRDNHTPGYIFHVSRCGSGGVRRYRDEDVDVFALVALDCRLIGYMPTESVKRTMIFRSEKHRGQYYDERLDGKRSKILEMKAAGITQRDIAAEVGCHEQHLSRVLTANFPRKRQYRYLNEMTFSEAISKFIEATSVGAAA